MKKGLSLLLSGCLMLGMLAGCGSSAASSAAPAEKRCSCCFRGSNRSNHCARSFRGRDFYARDRGRYHQLR